LAYTTYNRNYIITTPTIQESPVIASATVTPTLSLPDKQEVLCVPSTNQRVQATVVRIVDGDTIEVNIDGTEYTLRYIGVDTPEIGAPGGSEATEFNRSLVEGKSVILVKDVSEVDYFDRLLRYVFVDDKFINFELVNTGYAVSGSWPPDTSCDQTFANAYNSAFANNLGLFASTITPAPTIEPTATNTIVSLCPNGCTTQQPGCDIKGNVSSGGDKIYHLPGTNNYDDTVITPEEGELWFCSVEEAIANGWRAPR
jgi:micrococcal nuclease